MYSRYAQVFDKRSKLFTTNASTNLKKIKEIQSQCNEKLYEDGYLFLSDVYDMLDIFKLPCVEGVGWWVDYTDKENANHVDFGIYDRTKKTSRDFVNGLQPEIILDFNIDGNLGDYLLDLGLCIGESEIARDFFDRQEVYREYLTEAGYESVLWR